MTNRDPEKRIDRQMDDRPGAPCFAAPTPKPMNTTSQHFERAVMALMELSSVLLADGETNLSGIVAAGMQTVGYVEGLYLEIH